MEHRSKDKRGVVFRCENMFALINTSTESLCLLKRCLNDLKKCFRAIMISFAQPELGAMIVSMHKKKRYELFL